MGVISESDSNVEAEGVRFLDSIYDHKQQPDEITAVRTRDVALPIVNRELESSDVDLAGRVSDSQADSIQNLIQNTTPEQYEVLKNQLDQAADLAEDEWELNFIYELRKIIARVYEQQGQLSENDRIALDKLKFEYEDSIQKSSSFTKKIGSHGLFVALGFIGVFVVGAVIRNEGVSKVLQFLSSQSQVASQFVISFPQSRQKEEDGRSSLKLNTMQQVQTKKQSEGNQRQEYANVFQGAQELGKTTSRWVN